jgi:hypothetical protein
MLQVLTVMAVMTLPTFAAATPGHVVKHTFDPNLTYEASASLRSAKRDAVRPQTTERPRTRKAPPKYEGTPPNKVGQAQVRPSEPTLKGPMRLPFRMSERRFQRLPHNRSISDESRRISSTRVFGTVYLANCVANASDIRIRVVGNGQTREVPGVAMGRMRAFSGMVINTYSVGISYAIEDLAPGFYTISARLGGTRCAGGRWEPATVSRIVSSNLVGIRQDFRYTVPLSQLDLEQRVQERARRLPARPPLTMPR